MNKYLRDTINILVGLVILSGAVLVSCNIIVAGFLFFPDVIARVHIIMESNPNWQATYIPGLIPLIYLLLYLGVAIFFVITATKFVSRFDIEKIIKEIKGRVIYDGRKGTG